MGAIANLSAHLAWDIDDFQRGTVSIENAFKSIIGIAGDMANAVANAGKRMTMGLSLPLAGIGVMVTKAASDAGELQSAFDVTFGNMSKSMNRWAEEAGNRMGRATQEMQEGAIAFGQLFNQAAPTEAAAARMSQRFTELAQDAASFYNTDFDTAMGKIRSGLTGESEPLRDFGVFLNEAEVNAKGLEMGLIKSGQQLDEHGKIMARSALITEGLMKAYGDVARTSDSLANRIRALGGMVRELAVEFGSYLEPYAKRAAAMMAGLLQWIQDLPEGVKKAAVGFGVFLAALGPLSVVLSAIAFTILPMFLVNMGPVLLAISAIVNPIGTVVALLGKYATSWSVVSSALGKVLPLFLRIAGPIGIVIGLLQLFGDDIMRGFERFRDAVSEAVGPGLQEMFARLAGLVDQLFGAFEGLMQSPIGQFLADCAEMVGKLIEVFFHLTGTLAGEIISAIVEVLNMILDYISGMVDATYKLLTLDWAGAWDAAVQAVGRALLRISNWIREEWPLLAGFVGMLGRITGAELTSATPVREKAFGGLQDQKDAIADFASAGSGGGGRDYAVPEAPKAPPRGRGRAGGAGRGRTGPTKKELEDRREEIRLEQAMAVARERDDIEAIRALERQRDLKSAIERYERAGLSNADARAAAQRDILELEQARAETIARETESEERRLDLQLARLRNDYEAIEAQERKEYLAERVLFWRQKLLDVAEAQKRAEQDLADIEDARAVNAEQRAKDQELARQIELARLRGDDWQSIARMEEDARIRDRADELRSAFGVPEIDALEQAQREAADRSQAHLQGSFRDAFRNGLQAAMNGDLGGFFESWMRDRSFNALSKVLDKLADNLANLVSGNGSSGGLLGALGSALGFVKSTSGGPTNLLGGDPYAPPGFNTGGSFKVKGFPGIDKNLLSLNGNPIARVSSGEIMDIRRGESGGGGHATVTIVPTPYFDAHVDGRAATVAAPMAMQAAGAGSAGAQMSFARSRKRAMSS